MASSNDLVHQSIRAAKSVFSQYTLQDSDVTVSGGVITQCATSSTDWGTGDIIIPDLLDGQVVREIGAKAFEEKGITSVSLPQSLEIIGERSFALNGMVDLTIPKSVVYLGAGMLIATSSMRKVYFEDQSNIRIISPDALNLVTCINCLEPVILPDNANPGFSGYRNLNGVLFEPGDTIKNLRSYYYADIPVHTLSQSDVVVEDSVIKKLVNRYPKISIPAKFNENLVNTIGSMAFNNISLLEIQISDSIEYILSNAFAKNLLSNVTLPDGLKEIGNYAFSGNRLTTLDIPETIRTVGSFAFYINRLTSIQFPDTVFRIGNAAFNDNQLSLINGTATNGLIFNKLSNGAWDSTTIVSYGGLSDTVNFIPGTVKTLGNGAFRTSKIKRVVIPENVETIGDETFYNNLLDSINLPSSIVRINRQAFGVNNVRKVSFTEPSHLEYYGYSVFSQNYMLDSVVLPVPVVKYGYERFLGWFDDLGKIVSVLNADYPRPCEAKFEPVRYSITYENVIVNSINNPAFYTIESNYNLYEPMHIPEYIFAGWFTDSLFNNPVQNPAIPKGSTGDLTFYAKWDIETGNKPLPDNGINVYPGAGSGTLNISVTEDYNLTIFNASGIIHHRMKIVPGNNTLTMEKNYPGLYLIKLENTRRTIIKKVILE